MDWILVLLFWNALLHYYAVLITRGLHLPCISYFAPLLHSWETLILAKLEFDVCFMIAGRATKEITLTNGWWAFKGFFQGSWRSLPYFPERITRTDQRSSLLAAAFNYLHMNTNVSPVKITVGRSYTYRASATFEQFILPVWRSLFCPLVRPDSHSTRPTQPLEIVQRVHSNLSSSSVCHTRYCPSTSISPFFLANQKATLVPDVYCPSSAVYHAHPRSHRVSTTSSRCLFISRTISILSQSWTCFVLSSFGCSLGSQRWTPIFDTLDDWPFYPQAGRLTSSDRSGRLSKRSNTLLWSYSRRRLAAS